MLKRRNLALSLLALLACAALLDLALADTSSALYLPLVAVIGTPQAQAPEPAATAANTTTNTNTATSSAGAPAPSTTTPTSTATDSATATATATASATATATVTTTTTPPEPCAGIYPIGIHAATITGDAFNDVGIDPINSNEYMVLSNGLTQRRLYIKESGSPGSYVYLRWHEDVAPGGIQATSERALIEALSGEGNYGLGFEEAPWPVGEAAPEGYPTEPGTLNAGDWIWATPSWKSSAGINSVPSALNAHISSERPLILPIYGQLRGIGSNMQVLTTRLGLFRLVGHGREPARGMYLDLVFLGDPPGDIDLCPGATP